MAFSLTGEVPGLPMPLARTKINEALALIYETQMFSFQLKEANWLTPGLLFPDGSAPGQSAGTITTTAYSNQVIGDAIASAQWAAYANMPLLTQLQIRSPYYSLYNIIAYDTTTNAPFGTFTLDRPWMEPPNGTGTDIAYMIYQAYYAAPVADFKRFLAIRDTTNAAPLSYWKYSQRDLALIDPQRTNFDQPAYVVPYEVDQRVGSATFGYMLFELWPHPLSVLPYTYSYVRRGPALVQNSDTVPWPLNEELVGWRAKEISYLWKEAQKGDGFKRGEGADWRFLSGAARAEYDKRLKTVKDLDRDLCELHWNRVVRNFELGSQGEPFATIVGGLNVGGW